MLTSQSATWCTLEILGAVWTQSGSKTVVLKNGRAYVFVLVELSWIDATVLLDRSTFCVPADWPIDRNKLKLIACLSCCFLLLACPIRYGKVKANGKIKGIECFAFW